MTVMSDDAFVRQVQADLKAQGRYDGPIDGKAGEATVKALEAAWGTLGIPVASPPTRASIRVSGAAKRLDDVDLPRLGALLGVGEDEVHAVLDVECRGKGFDSKGRVVMLFEPHVFYRELGAGPARDLAVREGLAYASWGAKPYPADSYPRWEAACLIDEDAACRSASWGLGQIMGFNASLAGYGSARAMIEAFADDEEVHLEAMCRFIISAGLDDEMRAHDWDGFARGYNGPSYARHGYHTRLQGSYEWWARKPDTPWEPAEVRLASIGIRCPCPVAV